MKTQNIDEIMTEVHAAKDALSREARYDVGRLLNAARKRAGQVPIASGKTRSMTTRRTRARRDARVLA